VEYPGVPEYRDTSVLRETATGTRILDNGAPGAGRIAPEADLRGWVRQAIEFVGTLV
jgi:hypothetical protein